MGDLSVDTELEQLGPGRYRARVSRDWEIFGPDGGFLGALALRAAGCESSFARPASFSCHYLNSPEFDEVELEVARLRTSRRAESMRITMRQGDRPIMEALVWTVAPTDGIGHDTTDPPQVDRPEDVLPIEHYVPDWPPFAFWRNIDYRPMLMPGQRVGEPGRGWLRAWYRYRPTPTFDDLFVDAARCLILADTMVFPAAAMAHGKPFPYRATSLDVAVSFHHPQLATEWLLCDAESHTSDGGLVGGQVAIWSEDGKLLATAVQQMIQLG